MEVIVATDARLLRSDDGKVRSATDGRAYGFWTRYLSVFDSVRVLARVAESRSTDASEVEGDGVVVHPVPDFYGPTGYLRSRASVRAAVNGLLGGDQSKAYIARVPGVVGGLLTATLHRESIPYALEVVGDPYAAMRALSLPRGISSSLSHIGKRQLRGQCARAVAVSYVTSEALQSYYPAKPGAATACYSSVELPDSAFRERPSGQNLSNPPLAIMVATMSRRYKGHSTMLEAMAQLHDRGIPIRVLLAGDGRYRNEFEALALQLRVRSSVDFLGQLESPEAVQEELDRADVFVMPSRTEGLPRALIEAMARGLPCVASSVGGIPELLGDSELVPPGNPSALAEKLIELLDDPERCRRLSSRNVAKAKHFHRNALTAERKAFYAQVQNLSIDSPTRPS